MYTYKRDRERERERERETKEKGRRHEECSAYKLETNSRHSIIKIHY
jgi:hypothetical protein